ncbi:hypothetical protein ACCO45_008574 [Purpureocillium lilacinum]|uniref:Uncharacterized protein n=1 Tax=Purpureocillium lilacinum TaxID=33203 RepID=A0ACC4DP25_PURLI
MRDQSLQRRDEHIRRPGSTKSSTIGSVVAACASTSVSVFVCVCLSRDISPALPGLAPCARVASSWPATRPPPFEPLLGIVEGKAPPPAAAVVAPSRASGAFVPADAHASTAPGRARRAELLLVAQAS